MTTKFTATDLYNQYRAKGACHNLATLLTNSKVKNARLQGMELKPLPPNRLLKANFKF